MFSFYGVLDYASTSGAYFVLTLEMLRFCTSSTSNTSPHMVVSIWNHTLRNSLFHWSQPTPYFSLQLSLSLSQSSFPHLCTFISHPHTPHFPFVLPSSLSCLNTPLSLYLYTFKIPTFVLIPPLLQLSPHHSIRLKNGSDLKYYLFTLQMLPDL